ncbi:phage major capsid protein [Massilia sp. Root351]|uniref:phage major capsid protein n=1 Tax=Massilia sp. Root351 TaxID=1736522 RepID=UPI000A8ADDE0|nr:phage major capsid protein [Massilia sp. Root351]
MYERKNAGERHESQLELKQLGDALKQRDAEIKGFCEKAAAELKDLGRVSSETQQALQKLSDSGSEMQARVLEVEQKLARRAGGNDQVVKSVGEQFTDSDDFKGMQAKGGRGTARMELKAVTSITSATAGTGAAGATTRPDRVPGIISPAERQFTIRDLIMPGRTGTNAVEYVQETGFQNMADSAGELTQRAQSDLKFELKTAAVRTIGHWIHASREILNDAPQLQSYIDGRMVHGLRYKEEEKLLGGDGTGQNLLGLIPQASIFNEARRKAGDTPIDILRKGILQVRIAEFRASAIVLNPADWADIELQKDDTGGYIWVNVGTPSEPVMWRLPVVDTNAMPEGKFMVGAFMLGAQIFDREEASVQVSTEDKDNFVKGGVTILAEERLALAVYRPQSFVYGNLRAA